MTQTPHVTVIMRSKNSDWVIDQALAGLFSQDYTNFSLLVVDSGSTDRTLDIVAQFPAKLVCIPPENYYPGTVLNDAIAQTDTDIVVFQNSDVVPLNQHALRNLVAAFDDPEVMAAFARQAPRPEADLWVKRDYAVSFPAEGDAPPWITLSLPFAAMRRSAWEKHPFYTDAWGSEDTEWGHWAKQQGMKVKYVADAVVMHSHNYTLRQTFGRRFIEGEADAFIYRDHVSLVRGMGSAAIRALKDMAGHLAHSKTLPAIIKGIATSPARRGVEAWAYFKGHSHGERRIAAGDTDASGGQKVVLARHESARRSA